MVEMLGVLAIIGVLSIGGIAGYTLSMRRYRANQVAAALNKYAFIVYSTCQKVVSEGVITGVSSCGGQSFIPSYEDTGLPSISDVSAITDVGIGNMWGGNPDVDHVTLHVLFHDEAICKATASVIGYLSGPCNPALATKIKFE